MLFKLVLRKFYYVWNKKCILRKPTLHYFSNPFIKIYNLQFTNYFEIQLYLSMHLQITNYFGLQLLKSMPKDLQLQIVLDVEILKYILIIHTIYTYLNLRFSIHIQNIYSLQFRNEFVPVSSETPQQETPRTCTRQTPCCKQTCLGCSLPSDGKHIWNLTSALNTSTTTTTITTKPAPPINHWISDITNGLQEAILSEDLELLKSYNSLFTQKLMSEPDALQFDHSDLRVARNHALEIINSFPPVPNSNSLLQPNSPILLHPPPDLNHREWKFLDGLGKVTSFTLGSLRASQVLQLPTALKWPGLN